MPSSSSQAGGLLGSLFALGAAEPLLEGRGAGFDLGLGLPAGGPLGGGGGEASMQMQGLGLRGGGGGGPAGASSSGLFWPAGLLDNDSLDTWKMPPGAGVGAAMWPDFAAAGAAPQTGGLLHGGAQLM
ncbi:dof zinc finger protein DOF3.4-like [Panicum miliaceum]|uniref:Dof zinc finger protein DOF3.4-like n=1 Tax=Panicum miliaceum TaxID=4540 RepID=A0A3L6SEB5_PANMI|nr:dof zinc finger protein DOF3.4-like [Panicum miliaceum]